ncbi:DUF4236 domain-containing protein [Aneurinibacillus uraniidurans]|uniref:DUF4236 domain-containing protein n=1 Tax=Aneurinibacillus uraniidurans TaxID=2966586 RepID=UPI00234ABD70|nr:DUF4236 domain-containing protein [Aneurinibacillus sp. B1]WCN37581.1 DUF4236 domain-containing protein [Aneurinibacillus sp. B1]
MGFNFRKSINLGGGIRLSVSKSGLGVSAGVKGLRVGVGPGGARATASIPGTGLSYTTSLGPSRSARRRQTELQQRQAQRMAELELAQYEVDVYENQIELLKSMHKECSPSISWQQLNQMPPPFLHGNPGPNELHAQNELDNYKPGFIDKIFGRTDSKLSDLKNAIEEAKQLDNQKYEEWEALKKLSHSVIQQDLDSYVQVLNEFAPFEELDHVGSNFEVSLFPTKSEVTLYVNSDEVIPAEVKSLTKTGKLSIKKMTKTQFYDIYQDYVCSCLLRVAREMFAILPLEEVYIHAVGESLDSATGHEKQEVILSTCITRSILESLNLDSIDCSDAMSNFKHNMKFAKTKGFQPVEKFLF